MFKVNRYPATGLRNPWSPIVDYERQDNLTELDKRQQTHEKLSEKIILVLDNAS